MNKFENNNNSSENNNKQQRHFRRAIDFDQVDPRLLFGEQDIFLRKIQDQLGVELVVRNNEIKISGGAEACDHAARVIEAMIGLINDGHRLEVNDIDMAINLELGDVDDSKYDTYSFISLKSKTIKPRTPGQKTYLDAIRQHDIVFGIGPAGTGKTYLAVAAAIYALDVKSKVDRIVLVRPAVEAGESLGFLPGDFQEKVDPYLRPLYDALNEMLGYERVRRLMRIGAIEIAPLAYMRGRTLNNSFIILDEAQNTTLSQMKMFLTRMGFNSKAVITGDITQIDLTNHEASGLVRVQGILKGIDGIKFIYLTHEDVVRHPLVARVIQAFHDWDESKQNTQK